MYDAVNVQNCWFLTGVTATGKVRRSDYGIAPGFPAPMLGDVVKFELDLELLEPDS